MGELDLQTPEATRPVQGDATKQFPRERQAKRDLLLARVKEIGPILQAPVARAKSWQRSLLKRSRRCEARACLD